MNEAVAEETFIDFQPFQWLAINAPEPEVCLCLGSGGGKTWTGSRWILSRLMNFPDSVHLATINSYTQGKDLVIPALEEAAEHMGLDWQWVGGKNAPNLVVDLGDCRSEIRLRSTEKFNKLRGPEIGSWWPDEVRDAPEEALKIVMMRLRCKKVDLPRVLMTTTPNGQDEIYRMFVEGSKLAETIVDKKTGLNIRVYRSANGRRLMINGPTGLNTKVREGYVEFMGESLTGRLLKQERDGEFVPTGDVVYEDFSDANISDRATYDPKLLLFVALDFNVKPCVAALIQEVAGETLVVDEIVCDKGGSPMVIAEFKRRYPDRVGSRAPIVYGDASGHHGDHRAGMSDYARWTIEVPGAQIRVPIANGHVSDRINAVNFRLCDAQGNRFLYVNRKCREAIEDFRGVVYRKHDREPEKKKNPRRTHVSDAIGYYVVAVHPLRRFMDVEKLRQGDQKLWSK